MEHKSPRDAIGALDRCSDTSGQRTIKVSLINNTGWTIVVAFTRCEDLSGNVPSGFVSDTGVIVLASNLAGPATASIDPCHAGLGQRPCQATRITGNYKLRWPGDDAEYDYECPPGDDGDHTTYFKWISWTIEYSKGMNREGRPNVVVVPMKAPKTPAK